jgi:hypothetical protein
VESADFLLESSVIAGQVVEVPLADSEVIVELPIHLSDFVVFGEDKVDVGAGVLEKRLKAGRLRLSLFHLSAQAPPSLLLS